MKGGLVSMLYGAAAAHALRLLGDTRIVLHLVCDEETGSAAGSGHLRDAGLIDPAAAAMVTAEPTGGVVWHANRGAITLRVTVAGKEAHVGQAHLGDNAFLKLLRVAAPLGDLATDLLARRTAFPLDSEAARGSMLVVGGAAGAGANFKPCRVRVVLGPPPLQPRGGAGDRAGAPHGHDRGGGRGRRRRHRRSTSSSRRRRPPPRRPTRRPSRWLAASSRSRASRPASSSARARSRSAGTPSRASPPSPTGPAGWTSPTAPRSSSTKPRWAAARRPPARPPAGCGGCREHVGRVVRGLDLAQARPVAGPKNCSRRPAPRRSWGSRRRGAAARPRRCRRARARTATSDASSMTTPSAIMQISPGSVARAPAPGAVARQRPAHVAELEHRHRRAAARAGPDLRHQLVDRLRRQLVQQLVREVEGQRVERVHGQVAEHDRRHHRERVALGPEVAQRPQQRAALGLARRGTPPSRRRTSARGRTPARRGAAGSGCSDAHDMSSSGSVGQQRAPGVQHLGRALEREEHRARVELVDRVDVELDRGHDAEVAAAAAQRPEQVRRGARRRRARARRRR